MHLLHQRHCVFPVNFGLIATFIAIPKITFLSLKRLKTLHLVFLMKQFRNPIKKKFKTLWETFRQMNLEPVSHYTTFSEMNQFIIRKKKYFAFVTMNHRQKQLLQRGKKLMSIFLERGRHHKEIRKIQPSMNLTNVLFFSRSKSSFLFPFPLHSSICFRCFVDEGINPLLNKFLTTTTTPSQYWQIWKCGWICGGCFFFKKKKLPTPGRVSVTEQAAAAAVVEHTTWNSK